MLDRETDGALGGPAPTAEIIADAAALDGIADPWNKLFAEARPGNPFTSFEWCGAWWRGFGRSGKRLHVIAVYRRAALIGIIPLYREKYSRLGEVYRFLGTGRSDFPGVLAAVGHERAVLDAAWTSVVERLGYLDVLDLQDQKATDPFIAELRRKAVDARLSVHVRTKYVAPRIQFGPGGWDGYLTSKGASFRKRTRKIERRIAKTEGLAVARYQTSRMDGSDCGMALDVAAAIERGSWKYASGGERINTNSQSKAWFGEILDSFGKRGWLDFWLCTVGGQPAAYAVNFRVHDVVSAYNSAYLEEFAAHGPGALLHLCRIRDAAESGIRSYGFLRGREDYKFHWANEIDQLDQVVISLTSVNPFVLASLVRWRIAEVAAARQAWSHVVETRQRLLRRIGRP